MALLCMDDASATLVFKPGASKTGPGLYSTWSDLYAALQALRASNGGGGAYTIEFDDTVTTPCVVPAGTYDMRNVTWVGMRGRVTAAHGVEVADGAYFTDLLTFRNIAVLNKNSTAPAVALAPIASTDIVSITLDEASDISCHATGTQPMFKASGLTSGQRVGVTLSGGSSFGLMSNVNAVLDMSVSGTICTLQLGQGSAATHNTIKGHSGATLELKLISSGGEFPTFPNFAGTVKEVQEGALLAWPRFLMNPATGSSPSTSALNGNATYTSTPGYMHGNLLRLNSTSASFTQTLPSINNPTGGWKRPGGFIAVKNYGTANSVTVAAATGDTIDGAASFTLYAGETAWLVCDGVSRWLRMTCNLRLETSDGYYARIASNELLTNAVIKSTGDDNSLVVGGRASLGTNVGVLISNVAAAGGGLTSTANHQKHCKIASDVGQTGSAGYTILEVYAGETSTGSGSKLLIDAQVSGTSKFTIDRLGTADLAGGIRMKEPPALKSANYTLALDDFAIGFDTTAAARTATLPTAASASGQLYAIRNATGSNNVTIDPSGSETIDGAATATVAPGARVLIQSDGSGWVRIL